MFVYVRPRRRNAEEDHGPPDRPRNWNACSGMKRIMSDPSKLWASEYYLRTNRKWNASDKVKSCKTVG
ncbi:hypothetical protein [Peribacillus muralis]|uniref:hypothetical protein n=1 Tax=Peribacillus muralis TaxID=264697 RepID=UPI00366B3E61